MPLKGTLTGNYTAPVTLTSATYANPVTLTGTISLAAGAAGIKAASAWSIFNAGSILTPVTAVGAYGIELNAGGYVDNRGGGLITTRTGILVDGAAGSVVNAGSIAGYEFGVLLKSGGGVRNAVGGGITGSQSGVRLDATGSVSNAGTISGGTGSGQYGVVLAGGSVDNQTNARISGSTALALSGKGTVENAGSIVGSTTFGVELYSGGSLTNQANALISGPTALEVLGTAGHVTNAGIIAGDAKSGVGVKIANGSLTNAAGGTISGHIGVYGKGGATVTNAGSIGATGTNTIAVDLLAGAANRVIVDPGAAFSGVVDGGNTVGSSIVSTLELTAGSGALMGVGSSFVNFGSIAFDARADWKISGSTLGLANGQHISGFAPGDTIELTGVNAAYSSFSGGILTLTDGTHLVFAGTLSGKPVVTPSGGHTDITVACFRKGTRVLADAGEVAVEDLRPGMNVVSLLHRRLLPVRWVGSNIVDCTRRPCPAHVWPVRIEMGALGASLPHRDLWLSPDHALLVDGAFVPVRYLVNGASIAQVPCEVVEYFHVELDVHGVLCAEGVHAESYLDTGNRSAFTNTDELVARQPTNARVRLRTWR